MTKTSVVDKLNPLKAGIEKSDEEKDEGPSRKQRSGPQDKLKPLTNFTAALQLDAKFFSIATSKPWNRRAVAAVRDWSFAATIESSPFVSAHLLCIGVLVLVIFVVADCEFGIRVNTVRAAPDGVTGTCPVVTLLAPLLMGSQFPSGNTFRIEMLILPFSVGSLPPSRNNLGGRRRGAAVASRGAAVVA